MSGSVIAARRGDYASRTGRAPVREMLLAAPMLPVVILVFVYFALTIDGFSSAANLNNMARQFAPLLIASVGATLVFLVGGIDLSVGAAMSFAAVLGALAMRDSNSVTLGLAAGVMGGLVAGALNGIAVARYRLVPFVHTLGMLLTLRATAFLLSEGHSVGRLPAAATDLGRMSVAGAPLLLWLSFAIAAAAWFVLHRTGFGRAIYLLGANRRAAVFNGLRVVWVEFWVYCIAAALAALAGMIAVLRLGSGSPVLGDNLLLQVIAAVVIGGTSIHGGAGSVVRTVTGVALVTVLDKGLNLEGLAFYDQAIAIGIVIIVGSGLGTWLEQHRVGRAQSRLERASPIETASMHLVPAKPRSSTSINS